MIHSSIILPSPIEMIDVKPMNPFISKCQIKVCYVGNEPNRNRTVITKEVAKEIANSIPGNPIVGYFKPEQGDFDEHSRSIEIKGNKLLLSDITRPYGFVDLGARVWFQKFLDDDSVEREYLMTEGYLWTGQYPECERIITKGNNQSMELDRELTKGHWAKGKNGKPDFFIISEAIMSKLCILGDDQEPCFEGARIAKEIVQFSLDDGYKNQLFTMMEKMKEILKEGGAPVFKNYDVAIGDATWNSLYSALNGQGQIFGCYQQEDNNDTFAVFHSSKDDRFYRINFSLNEDNAVEISNEYSDITDNDSYNKESVYSVEDIASYELTLNSEPVQAVVEETPVVEEPITEEPTQVVVEETPSYNLEEIPEYVELRNVVTEITGKLNELTANYKLLEEQNISLKADNEVLSSFKAEAERKEKMDLINEFYMLSEQDKKEYIDNIDSYSLKAIEGELCIKCVRNGLSFDLDKDSKQNNEKPITYNLQEEDNASNTPAWVKAVLEVRKEKANI